MEGLNKRGAKLQEEQSKKAVKVGITLVVNYNRPTTMEISDDIFHNSEEVIVLAATDLRDLLNVIFQQLLSEIDAFEQKGSGWVLFSLKKLTMNIIEYDPMRESSFIELPKVIKNRKACINIKNNDLLCFKWANLANKHPVDRDQHPDRVASYKEFEDELDSSGIQFPV